MTEVAVAVLVCGCLLALLSVGDRRWGSAAMIVTTIGFLVAELSPVPRFVQAVSWAVVVSSAAVVASSIGRRTWRANRSTLFIAFASMLGLAAISLTRRAYPEIQIWLFVLTGVTLVALGLVMFRSVLHLRQGRRAARL